MSPTEARELLAIKYSPESVREAIGMARDVVGRGGPLAEFRFNLTKWALTREYRADLDECRSVADAIIVLAHEEG